MAVAPFEISGKPVSRIAQKHFHSGKWQDVLSASQNFVCSTQPLALAGGGPASEVGRREKTTSEVAGFLVGHEPRRNGF
jgi:hypothetical protein